MSVSRVTAIVLGQEMRERDRDKEKQRDGDKEKVIKHRFLNLRV